MPRSEVTDVAKRVVAFVGCDPHVLSGFIELDLARASLLFGLRYRTGPRHCDSTLVEDLEHAGVASYRAVATIRVAFGLHRSEKRRAARRSTSELPKLFVGVLANCSISRKRRSPQLAISGDFFTATDSQSPFRDD